MRTNTKAIRDSEKHKFNKEQACMKTLFFFQYGKNFVEYGKFFFQYAKFDFDFLILPAQNKSYLYYNIRRAIQNAQNYEYSRCRLARFL